MRTGNIADTIMQNVSSTTRSANTKTEEEVNPANSKIENGVKRDEYIPSPNEERAGLYKIDYDKNGSQKISFDSPENKSAVKPENPKISEKDNSAEKLTSNTDKVKVEVKRLKEKAERLKQQLRFADGEKAEQLRRQLKNVRRELAGKDSNSYRQISV